MARYGCRRERCQRVTYPGLHVPDADRRDEFLERLLEEYVLPCRPE